MGEYDVLVIAMRRTFCTYYIRISIIHLSNDLLTLRTVVAMEGQSSDVE